MFLDERVIALLNQVAGQIPQLDRVISALTHNHLLKGGVLMGLFWWLWFREEGTASRARLLAGLGGSMVAILVGRLLALTLPFRFRPMHDRGIELVLPRGANSMALEGWSSFPSDHAVMFFALAFALLSVSRRVGVLALLYVTFFIAFPRVYTGLHFFSDVLVGALVGILIGWLSFRMLSRHRMVLHLACRAQETPAPFYSMMFLLSFQVVEMFGSIRSMLSPIAKLL